MSQRSLLILALLPAGVGAREVMSWVPPYAIEACQATLTSHFGPYSPSNALTRVGLQFWVPTATGGVRLTTDYGVIEDDDIAWFRDWGRQHGVQVLLCIYNHVGGQWNWDLALAAFAEHRPALVSNLVATVLTHDLDGVDLDFEGLVSPTPSDRLAFKLFLAELQATLAPLGKVLTVDSFHSPLYNAPNMSWWPDWTNLVDAVHTMGYTDLYEGSLVTLPGLQGYPFRYSWQQNYGVQTAGLAPAVISMGLPGWVSTWGTGGRGSNVLDHLHECIYDCNVPASVCIWDLQLTGTAGATNWRSAPVWALLARLARYASEPVDADGDGMADVWEAAHFGGTNAVGGGWAEDWDGDGFDNRDEFVAGTDPTNAASVFALTIVSDGRGGVAVGYAARCIPRFDEAYGDLRRCYWLEHCADPRSSGWEPVPGSTIVPLEDCTITYTNLPADTAGLYRARASLR